MIIFSNVGNIDWESMGLEVATKLLRGAADYLASQGKDPHALLNAELDAADAAAVAELEARFPEKSGDGS